MEARVQALEAEVKDIRGRLEAIEALLVPELSQPGPPPLDEQIEASRARIRAQHRHVLKGGGF